MTQHAQGTFEIQMKPAADPSIQGLTRMTMDKRYHGPLEGIAKGEFLSAGDPKGGNAGYVALEVVSGKLDGKNGGFALQQFGLLDGGEQTLQVNVVPGSATGELVGLSGRLTITLNGGEHHYDLEYALPPVQ